MSCLGWLFRGEDSFLVQYPVVCWDSILEKPSSRDGKLTTAFLDGMWMSINYIYLFFGSRTVHEHRMTWVLTSKVQKHRMTWGNVTPFRKMINIDNSVWTASKHMLYNRVSSFQCFKIFDHFQGNTNFNINHIVTWTARSLVSCPKDKHQFNKLEIAAVYEYTTRSNSKTLMRSRKYCMVLYSELTFILVKKINFWKVKIMKTF